MLELYREESAVVALVAVVLVVFVVVHSGMKRFEDVGLPIVLVLLSLYTGKV